MNRICFRPAPATWAALLLIAVALAGCGTSKQDRSTRYPAGSGDYRRDGPHENPPANLAAVPDAVPRIEPLASGPNKPYVIGGTRYVPDTSGRPYRTKGRASWYGRQFHGRPTSSGEPYDMYAMTAAHPTLPIPSYVRVTRADTGRSVIVRINDRGPFHSGRVIDLSYVAAYKLDTLANGTGDVVVERIMPEDIRSGTALARTTSGSGLSRTAAEPLAIAPPASISTAATLAGPSSIMSQSGEPLRQASLKIPVPAAPVASRAPLLAASTGSIAGSTFLQLGVFGEARNAHMLANQVRTNLGGIGTIDVIETSDRMHRVRLGPFSDRNTAVANADIVYGQTGIRPHVLASDKH